MDNSLMISWYIGIDWEAKVPLVSFSLYQM